MNNFMDLSRELLSGQLADVLEEATQSTGKHIYQTDNGIRALTAEEAKIDSHARLIGLNQLTGALTTKNNKLQLEVKTRYSKALQMYAKSLRVTINLVEEQLKFRAEIEGFGYKAANLDLVTELCKDDFGSYRFKVPEYANISTFKMQEKLKENGGLDVADRWKEILSKHFPTSIEKEEVLRTQQWPSAFLADCAALRFQIEEAVEQIAKQGQNEGLDQIFESSGLDALLNEVTQRKERLMVRSTGREDTKELANAGGNTSVPNVIPETNHVLQGMRDVVTSYFGEKSLKQRLGARDPTLFDEIPFTPVLVQRMIGERSPQALPKCGVMFTEDCQSKIATLDSKEPTSGITVIQAAYGHNEGVVGSLIPVDSYYINEQRNIIPVIRPKTHRMMPTENSGELKLVANNSGTAALPSLSAEAVKSLKNFAERLEQFYGGPMDVEFVVDEEENTVYIVQARPLVPRKFEEAMYLQNIHLLQGDVLKGSTIGAAGGSLRLVNPSQIVASQTLGEALDKYQDLQNPQNIELIVVGRHAPATSHWATVFHNEGKPVLYLPQLAKFQSWMQKPDASILVSPQQGLAIALKFDKEPTLENLESSGVAVKGWVDYPAAPVISTSFQFQPKEKLEDVAIKALYPPLHSDEKWSNFQKYATQFDFEKLFQQLHRSQGEDLQIGLATLLYKFKSVLARHAGTIELDREQGLRIEAIQSYALMLAKDVLENGEYNPSNAAFCRKLLPLHFLHALIFSSVSSEELVNGDSLVTLALQELSVENAIAKDLEQQGIKLNSPYSLILLRLGKIAVREETAKMYCDLILKLDHNGQEKELSMLANILMGLHKVDMLSPWLNISFHNKPDITALSEDYNVQAQFFEELAQKRKILNALNVSAFAQPKSFQTQWQILNKELLDRVTGGDFANEYREADTAGKLACISMMNKLVDQFDLAIKALEGSRDYPLEKQLILFQTMLKGYSDLANSWHGQFKFSDSIDKCLQNASQVVNKKELKDVDLRFSKYFDVQAFGSTSGASKGRVMYPETLEDAFSVIHQELLTMLRILNKNAVGEEMPMPPLLKKALEALNLGNATGCDLMASGITLHYTKPLREHGVQYQISSETGTDKLKLKLRFSAQNENQRWDKIAHFMVALKVLGKFNIEEFDQNSRGIGFTFYLDGKDNFNALQSVLEKIEVASTEIAQPRRGVPDMSLNAALKVDNDQKGLNPIKDPRLVVEEFEKDCGVVSMMESRVLQNTLRQLVEKDPSYVETVLKKCWQTNRGHLYFFATTLPEELLKAGHSASPIAAHALQLIHSKYSDSQSSGIRLMRSVAEANANAVLITSDQLLKILINPEYDSSFDHTFEHALGILDAFMRQGSKLENFIPNLLQLLTANKPNINNNGLKVLDLLSKYRDNYSDEFREEIVGEIQQLNLPETVMTLVRDKLTSLK